MSSTSRSSNSLRTRTVRLPVAGVVARVDDRIGEALNISAGGALMRLRGGEPVPIGWDTPIALVRGAVAVRFAAHVLRALPEPAAPRAPDSWLVAVRFITPTVELLQMLPGLLDTPAGAVALRQHHRP